MKYVIIVKLFSASQESLNVLSIYFPGQMPTGHDNQFALHGDMPGMPPSPEAHLPPMHPDVFPSGMPPRSLPGQGNFNQSLSHPQEMAGEVW